MRCSVRPKTMNWRKSVFHRYATTQNTATMQLIIMASSPTPWKDYDTAEASFQ